MAKQQSYDVTARLVLLVTIPIKAVSYEDAVTEAQELRETDFVTIKGEFLDGSIRIGSVAQDRYWDTKQ